MNVTIHYAARCHKGLVRKINQDNFWCDGTYLEMVNEGLETPLVGTFGVQTPPMMVVFDGMGGEKFGEHASSIASQTFHELYQQYDPSNEADFLEGAMHVINSRVCAHGEELHVRNMGTTGAALLFGSDAVHICNVGDSRIYHHQQGKLTQVSLDHSLEIAGSSRKAPLTQYLGVPESEFIIQPYVARHPYQQGDRWLICSDGLTDMVSEETICAILDNTADLDEAGEKLLTAALEGGGRDNTTILLAEVEMGEATVEAVTPTVSTATVPPAPPTKSKRTVVLASVVAALSLIAVVIAALLLLIPDDHDEDAEDEGTTATESTSETTVPTDPTDEDDTDDHKTKPSNTQTTVSTEEAVTSSSDTQSTVTQESAEPDVTSPKEEVENGDTE